jgi:hypothetical protein
MEISPGEDISDAREGFSDGCQKGFVVQDGLGRFAMVNDRWHNGLVAGVDLL